MIALDIFNFIDELEKAIGADCRVMLFNAFDNTFSIQVNWMDDIHYRRSFHVQEMKYMRDIEMLKTYVVLDATRFYKLNTVGEE